jgi:HrpA-like RNA helicase
MADVLCASGGQVLVLHSVVPQEEQEAAMLPAIPGHCKVILSTNIAESSITIPDVCMVINTGLQRCLPSLSPLVTLFTRGTISAG